MSAPTPEQTTPTPDSSSDNDRISPAERAYGPQRDTPAWKRIDPDLSGGYEEVHLALDCDQSAVSPEEVTTS